MRLTLPGLVFPLAASCGIGYQWDRRQMGLGEGVWAWVGDLHMTLKTEDFSLMVESLN